MKVHLSVYFSDMRVFLTIAVDLVIEGIQEPVRFLIETKAKIFPITERFWYFSKKPHHEQFVLKLKEVRLLLSFNILLHMLTVGMSSFSVFILNSYSGFRRA